MIAHEQGPKLRLLLPDDAESLATVQLAAEMTPGVRVFVRAATSGPEFDNAALCYARWAGDPDQMGALDRKWLEGQAKRALRAGGGVVSLVGDAPDGFARYDMRQQELMSVEVRAAVTMAWLSGD